MGHPGNCFAGDCDCWRWQLVHSLGVGAKVGGAWSRDVCHHDCTAFCPFLRSCTLDLRAVFDWRLVITFATIGLLMAIVSMVFASRMLGFDLSRSAIAGMGGATCNGVMFGLPILSQAYGEIGIVSVSVLFMAQALCIVPFILISAEMGQSDETSLQRIVQKTAKTTLKNPIIIAITLGICVALLEIKLPIVLSKAMSMLGVAGPGIALFFVGVYAAIRERISCHWR